jgi:hypothetical protein
VTRTYGQMVVGGTYSVSFWYATTTESNYAPNNFQVTLGGTIVWNTVPTSTSWVRYANVLCCVVRCDAVLWCAAQCIVLYWWCLISHCARYLMPFYSFPPTIFCLSCCCARSWSTLPVSLRPRPR